MAMLERIARALHAIETEGSAANIEETLHAVFAEIPNHARTGQPRSSTSARKRDEQPALPYRIFRGFGDGLIWVGKGAAQNDMLTFKIAKPFDLWLHAKNHRGAHVIVQRKRGQDCPGELLVDAAMLAAHFSDARGEAIVEVQYTPRGQVRKPRKSPAGLVTVQTEKVLLLRTSEARLRLLLASETSGPPNKAN
jgi:predicted ribosome quality control (RQC) complex YloA/Tae2 family protein